MAWFGAGRLGSLGIAGKLCIYSMTAKTDDSRLYILGVAAWVETIMERTFVDVIAPGCGVVSDFV